MRALVIVDVQNAIDHPAWSRFGPRNNPDAERNIAKLLEVWRNRGWPVYHVRHDSAEETSPYRAGQPGHDFKPECSPAPGETVISKATNSAFIGTGLDRLLRDRGLSQLVICGVITNNSVEATARMAGNLGFETLIAEDACFTFARPDWAGTLRSANEVHAMSLANLDGEYCTVVTTQSLLDV